MEHWRDTRYRGYEVSDGYRVRSRNRIVKGRDGSSRFIKGRILTPVIRHGHPCVNIWRANGVKRIRIDALVADAFGLPMTPALRRALR